MRIIPSPQRLGTAFFWCLSQVASEGLPPSLQAGPCRAKVSGGFTTRKPWDAMFHIIMYIYIYRYTYTVYITKIDMGMFIWKRRDSMWLIMKTRIDYEEIYDKSGGWVWLGMPLTCKILQNGWLSKLDASIQSTNFWIRFWVLFEDVWPWHLSGSEGWALLLFGPRPEGPVIQLSKDVGNNQRCSDAEMVTWFAEATSNWEMV